jgi:hypothetical protein
MGFTRVILFIGLLLYTTATAQAQPLNGTAADTSGIVKTVEKMAEFPGGMNAWRTFLQNNLRANKPFMEMGAPAGRYNVQVQFIVDKEGKISNITPLTNYGFGFEAEVVRVIEQSGTWTPAAQKGRLVKSHHIQPVVFMSPADKITINTPPDLPLYTLLANTDNIVGIKSYIYKKEDITLLVDSGTVTTRDAGQFTIRVAKPGGTWIKVMLKGQTAPLELVHVEVLPEKTAPVTMPITQKPAAAAPAFAWLSWEAAIAAQQKKPLPITLFAYSPGKNDARIAEAEQLMFSGDGGAYVMEKSYPVRFNINGTDTLHQDGKMYTNSKPNERHPFAKWLGIKEGGPYVLVFDTQGKMRNKLDCSERSPKSVFGALSVVLSVLGMQ